MKFHQQFAVDENIARVWAFFDQPARVAECIPGMENVDVIDADHLSVRLTQKVGPIGATFESKVHITERVHQEKIQFTSTGKAVRGAVGNFRTTNTVVLVPDGTRTQVKVEGEAALAGMLGSIGQKVIVKQADKLTAEFARNLEGALSGRPQQLRAAVAAQTKALPFGKTRPEQTVTTKASVRDPWTIISAALSGLSIVLNLVILWRLGALS